MKQKRKTIKKLLIFGIMLLLFSCSEDLYEEPVHEITNKFKIRKTTFNKIKDVKIKSLVLKTQERMTQRSLNSTGKTLEDYIIDTTNVMEISDGIISSFTFPIISTDTTKFENLVSLKYNNQYKSYIAEYDLSAQEIEELNSNTSTIEITPDYITDLETNTRMASVGPCVLHSNETVLACTDVNGNTIITEGNLGDGCVGMSFDLIFDIITISPNCNVAGGGGSNDTGTSTGNTAPPAGGGGSGGNYSSNTPSDPSILTTPVQPVKNFNLQKTPCQQLKSNNTKPIANTTPSKTVLSNLTDLTTQMATNQRERMYIMTPETTAENQFVDTPPIQGPLNGGDVEYDLGSNAVSIMMHCHYNTTLLSIFSLSDIQQIYQSTQVGNIFSPDTFTSYLVTAHGTKYAIKFTAPPFETDSPYNQFFFTGWEIDAYKNMRENTYKTYVDKTNTPAQNELGFLKFLKDQNLGVEI